MCYRFYFVWICIWRQFPSISPRAYIDMGDFFFIIILGSLYLEAEFTSALLSRGAYEQSLCYGYHLSFILKLEPIVMALRVALKDTLRGTQKSLFAWRIPYTYIQKSCGWESARSTNGRWLNFMAIKANSKSCWRSLNFV